MRTHIEYDDFGEYVETRDLQVCDREYSGSLGEKIVKKMFREILLLTAAMMFLFGTTARAAETSGSAYPVQTYADTEPQQI